MKSYPFAAIVGQDRLKTALLLSAIDPSIGGVLVRGDKGSAKSTAARGLADVMPSIEAVPGCQFNCQAGSAIDACEVCRNPALEPQTRSAPFVNLPLGATEDRLIGSLDFERALKEGKRAFQPGLLAQAHRGVLYIDEVNLLADHLVDVLLDAAAMGVNTIEREGLTVSHPARLTLIGTMNPEEGDLRPQLLDRFGLMVEIGVPTTTAERVEVVRRRLSFEKDCLQFDRQWQSEQEYIRLQIINARDLLSHITLDDSIVELISHVCCQLEIRSLRADIVMNKVVRALIALSGGQSATSDDVRLAAELVLPHRRRRLPSEHPGLDDERLTQALQQKDADESKAKEPEQSRQQAKQPQQSRQPAQLCHQTSEKKDATAGMEPQHESVDGSGAVMPERIFAADLGQKTPLIQLRSTSPTQMSGRRNLSEGSTHGQYIRAELDANPTNLAVDATIRHAVMRSGAPLQVTHVDFHRKVKVGKEGSLIVIAVDSSGSMAALKRMQAVKGAALSLLEDAYQRRDYVAIVSVGGEEAQLLLPPTRSVAFARDRLMQLPTGGRTPLPHALSLIRHILQREAAQEGNSRRRQSFLVALTDGKANVPLKDFPGGDPWNQSLIEAQSLSRLLIPTLVIDTESGFIKFGRAEKLAASLNAEYLPLQDLTADRLALTIRNRMRSASRQ